MTEGPSAAGWQDAAGDLLPRPDPTRLTTDAVERATTQYRRELLGLREILETRLAGNDSQRALIWAELRSWPELLETRLEVRRREFLEDLQGVRELLEQRLGALDKSIKLAADQLASIPDSTEAERSKLEAENTRRMTAEREYVVALVENVRAVTAEKFAAVDGQFSSNDKALAAALSSQKEAVAEQNKANSAAIKVSEGNTKEQLTSLGQVSSANFKAQEDKITVALDRLAALELRLTSRLDRGEGQGEGVTAVTGTPYESSVLRQAEMSAETASRRAVMSQIIAMVAVLASIVSLVILALRK